ncbi:DUF4249 domain-containing protein [Spirosoma lituiforme]
MPLFKRIPSAVSTLINGLIVVGLFGGCSSLRNEVDPSQLGLASPKLVVSGYLSPQDTVLAIKLTRSNTVVGDSISLLQTNNDITDATVTLSDGSKSVKLTYITVHPTDSTEQSYYSASARLLPIVTGRTYTLSVLTANGQRASSTCTIPVPVKPTAITFDSLTQNQGRSLSRRYFVKAFWPDPAGQANYYQIAGYFRYQSRLNQPGNFPLTIDDDNRGLFSDEGLDGTTMVSGRSFVTSTTFAANESTNFYDQYRAASVTVNLMSVDQAYYQFQTAAIRQRRVRNNPFAEPVLIPSNIQGGLGCFAGYNNSTITLRLK